MALIRAKAEERAEDGVMGILLRAVAGSREEDVNVLFAQIVK
jgi:hypothetical protein